MLGFVATDAKVSAALLQRALQAVAADTFNAITVDGDSSTNDCVFAMASGVSGVEIDDELYPALVAGFHTGPPTPATIPLLASSENAS